MEKTTIVYDENAINAQDRFLYDDEDDEGQSYINDENALNDLIISFSILYGMIRIFY